VTDFGERLSAYLDGELPDAEALEVEALLEHDAEARAEFDALMEANALAQDAFEEMLSAPASLALARAIDRAEIPEAGDVEDVPATTQDAAAPTTSNVTPMRRSGVPTWAAIAAGVCLMVGGGVMGYGAGSLNQPQSTPPGWLSQIAEYHAVYSTQSRHLVEVSADESEHIQTWLGNVTGANFTIPDLSAQGLSFQGGRLLVAGGKPVAQLVYTDAAGEVLALCLQATDRPDDPSLNPTTIDGFDMVSWRNNGAAYVVVGPTAYPNLSQIAADAADEV